MDKLIVLLTIVILAGSVLAADVTITITIPSEKVADFSAAFEAYMPVPVLPDPSFVDDPNAPDDTATMIPEITQKEWLKKVVINFLKRCYHKGKIIQARESAVVDPDILGN